MFFSEQKTFHDSIKPLVYFNCWCGIGAFRQTNQTSFTYSLVILYTAFVNLANWTMIYITLKASTEVVIPDDLPPMAFRMSKALIYANSCIGVIAPFLVWLQSKKFKDCVKQMATLDQTFETVLGAANEYRKQCVDLIRRIIGIMVVMFLVSLFDSLFGEGVEKEMSKQSPLMYISVLQTVHHPIGIMLVLDVNFCTFVGYLGKKFRDLNESLLRLGDKPDSVSGPSVTLFMVSGNKAKNRKAKGLVNSLREIRKAHLEVCKLSRKINLAFGIQNLLSTGLSFVIITGVLYTIYSIISSTSYTNSKLTATIPSIFWTVIYILKIWMVNHSCWSVSNEADKTGEVVYELLNSKMDKEVRQEIQEFGVQMLQNPVRFNACGFFTLDYTFVQGVIGSITTYLVILIQISTGPSKIPAFNDTKMTPN